MHTEHYSWWSPSLNREMALKEKNVPAWIDFWGPDVNHDWPWWYRQMNYFLGHLYG